MCEILSRFNLAVMCYGPVKDFGYVCFVTLILETCPWVNVITHPWVMDNNCVKYYPDTHRWVMNKNCVSTDKFLSFFLTVIYICSELSISISFSRFSVFSHISKNSTTTVYPCITLILFFLNIHLSFGLTAALLYNQLQIR